MRAIGKQPIRTKDRSGFIVNMLLIPYLMAAIRMFEEGFATREDIDAGHALRLPATRWARSPCCDFIGLDTSTPWATSCTRSSSEPSTRRRRC